MARKSSRPEQPAPVVMRQSLLLRWIGLDVCGPIVSGDVLTVSDDVVGNIRIASFKSVRICTAHQAIHSLMNDACKIFSTGVASS